MNTHYVVYDKHGEILRSGFCQGQKTLYIIADPLQEEYVIEGKGQSRTHCVKDFKVVLKATPDPPPEMTWKQKRAWAYPRIEKFAEAYVNLNSGDPDLMAEGATQMDKYVKACLKVKTDNPKPKDIA